MFFLLKLVLGLVVLALALGFFRTWQVENSDDAKLFASSSAPTVKLDGFYKGSVSSPVKITWAGKKFSAASSTGINIFDDGSGSTSEKYPFTLIDGNHDGKKVLDINYDRPENPFWVRPILDELVQTEKGTYLGKLTLRVVPSYPFSLGFFRLSK